MIYTKFRSLADFGKSIGWTRQKVDRIVNGKAQPNIADLKAMCDVLNISLDEGIAFFIQ